MLARVAAGPVQSGAERGSVSAFGARSASSRSTAAAPWGVPVQRVLHAAACPAHACARAVQHAPPGPGSKAALPCTPAHTLQRSTPGPARARCSTRARRALHTHTNTHMCCGTRVHTPLLHTHTCTAVHSPSCTLIHTVQCKRTPLVHLCTCCSAHAPKHTHSSAHPHVAVHTLPLAHPHGL